MNTQSETETQPLTHTSVSVPAGLNRIVLTGFMGAGKSTIGRLLAGRLSWNFLDLDAHIERRAGSTVPEIFAQHGEARFRRLESTALASALTHRSTVIALGGGAPESLTNRLLVEQTPGTFTIFLDAPFPTLFDRCVLQDVGDPAFSRPVLSDPGAAQARFISRRPLYTRLARLIITTNGLTPMETVETLLAGLNKLPLAP